MDKRKTDRLTVNPITKQLIDFVIDKWVERMIKSIQYQANQDTQFFNLKHEV